MNRSIAAGACGVIAGVLGTLAVTAIAQKGPGVPDPQYAIASPKENYVWRLNVWTGELVHCYKGPQGIICNRTSNAK